MSAESELGVVCRNCGAEVSAFVTECPYCGQRLRKRAPKLRRVDGEVDFEAPAKKRRSRLRRPRPRIPAVELGEGRPWATGAVLLAAGILVVVRRAAELSLVDVGAVTSLDAEWWRFLAAPFVYDDLGYLFAAGLGIAIFGAALERRIGLVPAFVLLIGCGSLGILAAESIQSGAYVIAGGNGMALGTLAAWTAFARREEHPYEEDAPDWIAVGVAAAVLLLIPLVEDTADPIAGIGGGLVGLLAGETAVRARRSPT